MVKKLFQGGAGPDQAMIALDDTEGRLVMAKSEAVIASPDLDEAANQGSSRT